MRYKIFDEKIYFTGDIYLKTQNFCGILHLKALAENKYFL